MLTFQFYLYVCCAYTCMSVCLDINVILNLSLDFQFYFISILFHLLS